MTGNVFIDNYAVDGGVLFSNSSDTIMEACEFRHNTGFYGGVQYMVNSTITIIACVFLNNNVGVEGGVLHSSNGTVTIEASVFHNSSADTFGGALYLQKSTITIDTSEFVSSVARQGGVLNSLSSTITIGGSNFTKNSSPVGAVIYAIDNTKIQYHDNLLIDGNSAEWFAVVLLFGSEFRGHDSGKFTFSRNLGSLSAFNSNITISGFAKFMNNRPDPSMLTLQEGGALTLFQSNVYFDGICILQHNSAENGGAVHSTDSKLYVNHNVTIAHNTVNGNGGGFYLSASELNCQHTSVFVLFNNSAEHKGGGLHAISSSIKVSSNFMDEYNCSSGLEAVLYSGARMNITKNAASLGGGLSLEANAKLYILRNDEGLNDLTSDVKFNTVIFVSNHAGYGGAVYVDDDTNFGACVSEPKTECFFQVLDIYNYNPGDPNYYKESSMYFSQNYANTSGSTLYGGLLDRCAVSPFADFSKVNAPTDIDTGGGIAYFTDVSTFSDTRFSASSGPVRVCLCMNKILDCTRQNHIESVKKGFTFTVSVVAMDQVGKPVNATIQTSLHFPESGLAEGQLARKIHAECTNLTFNVVSPSDVENLTLYASDGPCKDAQLSRVTVQIHFLNCSCPIGLQVSDSEMNATNCTCECQSAISQYMKHCDSHTGSLVKQPQSRVWISYINDTNLTGYLVYPNCPFGYCLSTSPPFYLNQPDGADAQCAFNRSSLMCGSCRPGLSLSLGSSRCLQCPSYWPALLIAITIAAVLAGIALVALLLVLNMTVAVGTLNGLIFYVNVVYSNKSILLPFHETNFITVFISWLNLDLGIETCYFPEMDTYIKTWLQLAFPTYIILLVVLVIIFSSYSSKFSNLLGMKDPVATLATLVLLSYAKLLEVCFKSLSVGILEYPNGSSEMLWLPDANIKYLSGKHIPLFIAAVLVLLIGMVFTALLFSWQYLLHLPKWKVFKWSRNPKIQTFIETYNKPYTPKHRYWTGLLLIVRVVLYLVAAANVSNDPTVAFLSISFLVGLIVFVNGSRVYRKWTLGLLETSFCFNVFVFTTLMWYSLSDKRLHKEALAYTSVTITIVTLLFIILYHVYTYTTVFSKAKRTKFGRMIDRLFPVIDSPNANDHPTARQNRWNQPPDDDIHRFDELLDELDCPVNTDDYNTVPLLRGPPVEPTRSVVEMHQPCLAPLVPDEGDN